LLYGNLKTKENSKLLAPKMVLGAYKGCCLQEVPKKNLSSGKPVTEEVVAYEWRSLLDIKALANEDTLLQTHFC